jgi:hypothetical protein
MKTTTRSPMLSVEWSDEDGFWLGYCLDLFPYGAVCHADTLAETFAKLSELVHKELANR